MACDLCGKTGTTLEDLRPQYQTQTVKALCPECIRLINKHLDKARTLGLNIAEELVRARLGGGTPEPVKKKPRCMKCLFWQAVTLLVAIAWKLSL